MDLTGNSFVPSPYIGLSFISNKLTRKYKNGQQAERIKRPESPLKETVFEENEFPFSIPLFELLKPSSAELAWCEDTQASGIHPEGASPDLKSWDPEAEESQLP